MWRGESSSCDVRFLKGVKKSTKMPRKSKVKKVYDIEQVESGKLSGVYGGKMAGKVDRKASNDDLETERKKFEARLRREQAFVKSNEVRRMEKKKEEPAATMKLVQGETMRDFSRRVDVAAAEKLNALASQEKRKRKRERRKEKREKSNADDDDDEDDWNSKSIVKRMKRGKRHDDDDDEVDSRKPKPLAATPEAPPNFSFLNEKKRITQLSFVKKNM